METWALLMVTECISKTILLKYKTRIRAQMEHCEHHRVERKLRPWEGLLSGLCGDLRN